MAETAVLIAREKAATRGLAADFAVADALHLDRLGQMFDTVLDCGLFHTFDAEERRDYVASLASVTSPGARLYVLCFSDAGPDTGPHPIRRDELRAAFGRSGGWSIASVSPDRIQTRFNAPGAPAWLAKIERGYSKTDARSPTRSLASRSSTHAGLNRDGLLIVTVPETVEATVAQALQAA